MELADHIRGWMLTEGGQLPKVMKGQAECLLRYRYMDGMLPLLVPPYHEDVAIRVLDAVWRTDEA